MFGPIAVVLSTTGSIAALWVGEMRLALRPANALHCISDLEAIIGLFPGSECFWPGLLERLLQQQHNN